MLKSKTVILGVTGGIAAYKVANLASMLVKSGADVHVIMTENAKNFINPITFETLTSHKCLVDTFDRNFVYDVKHVSLAKKADVMLIAPATANIIGKLSSGIADDMLSTTALACDCPKIVAPAMNTAMYHNAIVQDNIDRLRLYDYKIIKPSAGYLACGDIGEGKLPDTEELYEYIVREIAYKKDLSGKHILVTAGATREAIDPVRFISNHSTGKMGIELARAATYRGAKVRLILGNTTEAKPRFVDIIDVISSEDMYNAVMENAEKADIIIKAAAVSDYTPMSYSDKKIKKSVQEFSIELKRTKDILKTVGIQKKSHQFICGFSMETDNLIENSRRKLYDKGIDMIVANNLRDTGAGFGVDTNIVTIITKGEEIKLGLMSKTKVAHAILDEIVAEI